MENQRPQSGKVMTCCLAAAFSLLIVATDTAQAQRRPDGTIDLKREQHQRDHREAILRTTEAGATIAKIDQKRVEAAIKQVREDFKQIQIVRNELVRSLLAEKPLDYKLISDKTADINKRAARLKIFLIPPSADDKNKDKNQKVQVDLTKEEIKDALIQLCNLVAGFIDNPVLKNPGITDVEQSIKAGGDLLSIIQLSDNIKKSAEKLNKSSQ
jgi:hypothetical protein